MLITLWKHLLHITISLFFFPSSSSFFNAGWTHAARTWKYLHAVQHTPAAVRIPGAQTLIAGRILLTSLHWNTSELNAREQEGENQPVRIETSRHRQVGRILPRHVGRFSEEAQQQIVFLTAGVYRNNMNPIQKKKSNPLQKYIYLK